VAKAQKLSKADLAKDANLDLITHTSKKRQRDQIEATTGSSFAEIDDEHVEISGKSGPSNTAIRQCMNDLDLEKDNSLISKLFEIDSIFTTGVFIRIDRENCMIEACSDDAINTACLKKVKTAFNKIYYRG
jgi:hypothetical protein